MKEQLEIEIKYNVPIEVNKEKYLSIISKYCGIIAHREENGRYFIKVLIVKYAHGLKKFLNSK